MFPLDPEASVGFLLHDVARMMRAQFDRRAQELGLTRAQWRVLVHLAPREGLNQAALAEILEIDTVTLGRHIDRLERAGWLERRPDPGDRRAWRLYLTEALQPTLDRMAALAVEVHSGALSALGPDEQARLVDMLARMKQRLAPAQPPDAASRAVAAV